jgi:hypothetical protein
MWWSGGPLAGNVRRGSIAVSAGEPTALRFLPIYFDGVATGSRPAGVAGLPSDLIAIAKRSVLIDELVVGVPTLVGAGLLLMQVGLCACALGLRARDPRLTFCLLGTLLAQLGRLAMLSGSRLTALLQLALALALGHATAHREQDQRRNDQDDHDDDRNQQSS